MKSTIQIQNVISDFLSKNYKHSRLYGRGNEYGDLVIQSHTEYMQKYGFDIISRHESVTGEAIFYTLDDLTPRIMGDKETKKRLLSK